MAAATHWSPIDLANEFDLDVGTVKKRISGVTPIKSTHNNRRHVYLMRDVCRPLLGISAGAVVSDLPDLDPQQEAARLNLARREKVELETSVARGELMAFEEVEEVWTEHITNCKVKLLGLPSRLAHQVAAADDVGEIKDLIETCVREALEDLAEDELKQQKKTSKGDKKSLDAAA
jgi:phage terminase Nu1 subunit (DNA packaging protein)